MIFAICNAIATVIMWLVLKDISGLSKQELKTLYSPLNLKSARMSTYSTKLDDDEE